MEISDDIRDLDADIRDLGLESGYIAAWKYENKYIVAYENKIIQIVKPDEKHEIHWNIKFPLIEETLGLELIYERSANDK